MFNASQCLNIPEELIPKIAPGISVTDPLLECEAIIADMPDRPIRDGLTELINGFSEYKVIMKPIPALILSNN